MGVVYKAVDTKLERTVALKFLSPLLVQDSEVRKRFEREAKAAAALSHPNVCTIYEIDETGGRMFIAMEFVEGDSLDKKIESGPLKLEEALDIGGQIAKGLEAAHKKKIYHRDIKPQNVMVGDDGHVTVMDFGLAQLANRSRLTRDGTTLGTMAYMSPEQTEGSGTDHHTDIWSLGVVLYEMTTGQHPFKGDYDQAVMYSILNEQPEPMTGLRTGVPMELEAATAKCMAKAKKDRYGAAAELGRDLRVLADKLKAGAADARAEPEESPSRFLASMASGERSGYWKRWSYLWTAIGSGLLVAGVFWGLGRPAAPDSAPVTRLHLNLPGLNQYAEAHTVFALSPDGGSVVFETNEMLYLREMGGLDVAPISGTEGGYGPFFSPDGEWLGFLTATQVKRVSMRGGAPTTLANVANPSTAVWTPNDDIIFDLVGPTGLKKIPATESGALEDFTTREGDALDHDSPVILPDGDTVVFGIVRGGMTSWDGADIVAQSLTTSQRKVLIAGAGAETRFAASGHLVFARAGALLAAPFDATRLEVTGEPTPVVESVMNWRDGGTQFALTQGGTLAYIASDVGGGRSRALVWVERDGREQAVGLEPRPYYYPRISPDGLSLAMSVEGQELNLDVLVYDLERNVLKRTLTQY